MIILIASEPHSIYSAVTKKKKPSRNLEKGTAEVFQ